MKADLATMHTMRGSSSAVDASRLRSRLGRVVDEAFTPTLAVEDDSASSISDDSPEASFFDSSLHLWRLAPEILPTEGEDAFTLDATTVFVQDYLGQECTDLIRRFKQATPFETPAHVDRSLWDIQKTEVARVMVALTGPHRACFLIDDMGNGKSIIAIVATVLLHEPSPGNFFRPSDFLRARLILIVCTKSTVSQWEDQIRQCFAAKSRPSVKVVTNQTTAHELWSGQYDVAIATFGTVMHQKDRLDGHKAFLDCADRKGLQVAKNVAKDRGWTTRKPTACLFSGSMEIHGFRFGTVIVDEVHMVKLKSPGRCVN